MTGSAAKVEKTTLILVRHGETQWNREGKYQGSRSDIALSEKGIEQARCLGRTLRGTKLDAVYSSPADRAVSTAKHLLDAAGIGDLEIGMDDRLRETDFGLWEGLTYKEIIAQDEGRFQRWFDDPSAVAPPDGETLEAVADRAWRSAREIASRHEGGTVLAVTHGGPLLAVIASALGLPLNNIRRINQGNCRLNVLFFYGDYVYVDLLNAKELCSVK